MSGIHEEVFRESTAGRRVEGLFGGKLWRDGRERTAKLQGLRETSGIQKQVWVFTRKYLNNMIDRYPTRVYISYKADIPLRGILLSISYGGEHG